MCECVCQCGRSLTSLYSWWELNNINLQWYFEQLSVFAAANTGEHFYLNLFRPNEICYAFPSFNASPTQPKNEPYFSPSEPENDFEVAHRSSVAIRPPAPDRGVVGWCQCLLLNLCSEATSDKVVCT